MLAAIAAEFNLSETAFVSRKAAAGPFDLRWFTPACEVPLCGHATLASAHALWQWGVAPAGEPIEFRTRWSGILICAPRESGRIAMDFPPARARSCDAPPNAAGVLGVDGPILFAGSSEMNMLLEVPSESQVRAATPDFGTLATWHPVGVIVTARADDGALDFVSRFFAPAVGIDEDPVTGAAHCALAPHWAERLGKRAMHRRRSSRSAAGGSRSRCAIATEPSASSSSVERSP
jgi:PhzF family phenazine biosynthesis protein